MHTSAGLGDSRYQEPLPLRNARRYVLPLSLEKETEEELVWDSLAVKRPLILERDGEVFWYARGTT